MKLVFAIALGGAVGAVARHLVGHQMAVWLGAGFPWGTLTVNVVGCFAMGALVETMALVWSPGAALRGFLTVGLLGAFTTFSAFSLDIALLHERDEMGLALAYCLLSVSLSIGGLFAGLAATRLVLH